ncbi:MAG TPA: DUF3857 domain-containing protein [Candidatus Limnocylindrales bacterium]|jgi:hypothetical protein|nr:DUF3857 domain-containing protein [Candidatus Limnocylindrales bacterium]
MRTALRLSLCCLLFTLAAFGQKQDWLPITQQDLQYKEVPGNKGASAVRLYYAQYLDDNTSTCFIYQRIKILNEKALNPDSRGKTYADVEIPILTITGIVEDIADLKARTIKPDGSILDFTGKPYEKVIFKGRGDKLSVKAFSMPEVSVGSIIEYKYTAKVSVPSNGFVKVFARDSWDIQDELFTVKESLFYRPFGGTDFQSASRPQFYFDGARVSHVTMNLKEKPQDRGNDSVLELTNVPAFEREEFMPPENNYKPSVIFFYGRRGNPSVDKEWQEIGKERYEELERFLAGSRGVKEAAMQAMGSETDPGLKLRKLYERAQSIRNLTYERERTAEERKAEHIQRNVDVGDVLAHGYGSRLDITLLFVAMARSAGFDASVVQVANRRNRFFVKDWTSIRQLDAVMAVVTLPTGDVYLEPGIRFCPYGQVRWIHTAIEGLRIDKKGGTFVKAPPVSYDKSVTRRTADLSLSEDGTLKGSVLLEFTGAEALEHRLDAIESDEAGRKKDMEDELKQWLPAGAIVKMQASDGWEGAEQPLVARFDVELPNYASLAGKRFLVPSYLFQLKQNEAFSHSQRKYPVYLPYAFTDFDNVTIKVPAGFTTESIPAPQQAKLPYAKYQMTTRFENGELVSQRALFFNGIFFPLEKYSELQGFFGTVRTGDEQQAVLHGGSVSAQKGN